MSSDAGYMLIRVNLQGAREAAAEAAVLRGEIAGTGSAATAAGTAASSNAKKTSKMRTAWSGAAKAAKLGALGLVGAGAGIALAAKAGIEETLELSKTAAGLSRNLGITAREGTQWGAVAKARGIDTKSLTMAFTTLSRQMVAADKDWGATTNKFKDLGITQDEVAKGSKNFGFMVDVLADKLGNAEGSAERQAAAATLLGRGYQTVLPMFAKGSKGLQEQLEWADKYHVAFGKQMVDDNMALVNAQRESTVAWMGIKAELSEQFLPVLMDAHKEFQDFAKVMTDPKLSDTQKLEYIADKIKLVADKGTDLLVAMIPDAAERIATTAPKVAGAFISGFMHANIWGKLAIGYFIASKLVAGSLLATIASAGAKVGMAFGKKFVESALLWMMGTNIGSSLLGMFMPAGKFSTKFGEAARLMGSRAGKLLGKGMMVGLILALPLLAPMAYNFGKKIGEAIRDPVKEIFADVLNWFIDKANDVIGAFNKVNPFGDVGTIDPMLSPSDQDLLNTIYGATAAANNATGGGFRATHPNAFAPPASGGGGGGGGNQRPSTTRPKRVGMSDYKTALLEPDDPAGTRLSVPSAGREQPIILQVDGKKMAEVVAKIGQDAKARK